MMKRLFILSVIVALAVSLLASCSKEPSVVRIPVASDVPINFASLIPETKGAPQLISLERLAAQDFSVSAWYAPEGETFGSSSIRYFNNHRFGTLDLENYSLWQGINSTRDAAAPVYYPLDGSLTYFCFAPYRADVDPAGSSDIKLIPEPSSTITDQLPNYLPYSPLIVFTPEVYPSRQIDFITSTPIVDATRASGSLPLDFTNHLTSSIEFYCKYSGAIDPTEGVMIDQIVIRDVISSEYLYFTESAGVFGHDWCSTISPDDPLSSTMPVTTYTLKAANGDLITADAFLSDTGYKYVNNTNNGCLYLLPQTLPADAYLDITYSIRRRITNASLDENVVSIPISGTSAWLPNKIIRYYIAVNIANRNDVELTVSIIDWNDSGNTHAEMELMY